VAKTNVEHSLVSLDVLGNVDVEHRPVLRPNETPSELSHYSVRLGEQLPGLGRVAHNVSTLTQKPQTGCTDVKPSAHPVTTLRRWNDLSQTQPLNVGDPSEGIINDLRLQSPLAFVCNMAIHLTSTGRIAFHESPIRRRFHNIDHSSVNHIATFPINPYSHSFARDGTLD
jgi:hypothetical protein